MRVICIDDRDRPPFGLCEIKIKEGKVYKVVGSRICTATGATCYQLAGINILYDSNRFVPLSSIDETEFERSYKKELA